MSVSGICAKCVFAEDQTARAGSVTWICWAKKLQYNAPPPDCAQFQAKPMAAPTPGAPPGYVAPAYNPAAKQTGVPEASRPSQGQHTLNPPAPAAHATEALPGQAAPGKISGFAMVGAPAGDLFGTAATDPSAKPVAPAPGPSPGSEPQGDGLHDPASGHSGLFSRPSAALSVAFTSHEEGDAVAVQYSDGVAGLEQRRAQFVGSDLRGWAGIGLMSALLIGLLYYLLMSSDGAIAVYGLTQESHEREVREAYKFGLKEGGGAKKRKPNTPAPAEAASATVQAADTAAAATATGEAVAAGSGEKPAAEKAPEAEPAAPAAAKMIGPKLKTPVWIIGDMGRAKAAQAQERVDWLKEQGYAAAGYLWMPDYASLSPLPKYYTYVATYADKAAAEKGLLDYRTKIGAGWKAAGFSKGYLEYVDTRPAE